MHTQPFCRSQATSQEVMQAAHLLLAQHIFYRQVQAAHMCLKHAQPPSRSWPQRL